MAAVKRALKRNDLIAAIDFGTTKICVIVGQKTGEGIEVVGLGKQPSLGIRKGLVVNIPATVEAIQKARETAELMAGCPIDKAYLGIAGTHIKGINSSGVVAVKNKEVSAEDIDRAVDAARAIPIPADREIIHVIPQEFTVNDQEGIRDPIGMCGVRLESKVHIVTGTIASSQNIVKCASLAGIQVSDIVLESLASAEAVLNSDERELGVALVDIGGGTTDIAVYVRGGVVHTGVIPMGGNHITNDIAVGLRTSVQHAENIKIQSGCAMTSLLHEDQSFQIPAVGDRKGREVSRSVLTKIIEPRVEELFSLISQELTSCGFKQQIASGVVVTGGGALLEGMPELGEFILEMPVRRGTPQGIGGLLETVSSPIYATAVGLILQGTRHTVGRVFGHPSDPKGYAAVFNRMRSWISDII